MAEETQVSIPRPRIRGRGFRVQQIDYSASYRRGFHSHEVSSITLVLDGVLGESACGREETASTLSVVVKPAGTSHANHVGPRGARTIQVELDDESAWLPPGVDLGSWRWLHAGPGVRPLLGLQHVLQRRAGGLDPEEALLELLGEVLDTAGPTRHPAPPFVQRARQALDDLATEGIRVQELADELNVHPVSLTRAFRRAFGLSVSAYRRRTRLQRAAARVVATDRELGSIALATGFADQAHMCREVRNATGLSPSRLREVARG